ncbi:MAG: tetratricopeptide repeat protein, partial [bacterium]
MKRLLYIFYLTLTIFILFSLVPVIVNAQEQPKVVEEMYFLDQIKESPQKLDPYLGLGKWYIQHRMFDKAEPILSQATAISPTAAAGFALFGDLYTAQQKFNLAIGMYQTALQLEPDNAQNWYALGTLYRRNGKSSEALAAYLKAEPGFSKGGMEYTRFYADLAALYVNSGKMNEAEKLVDKLIKQEPKATSNLAAIGDIYTAIRLYDKAFPYYEQALSLNPNDIQLINRIIYSYRNSERKKEMIAFAKKAIEKTNDPERAMQIWNQISNMYYQQGNISDLVDLYDAVCTVVTDKTSRQNILGTLIGYGSNQADSLIPIFEARYKKTSKDTEVIWILAELYNRTNQSDKAISFYEKLRELQPADFRPITPLAMLYQKKDNFEKAIALRQEALTRNPDDSSNLVSLFRLYLRAGKKEQANELVTKLKEKSANNQTALKQLISVYRDLDQSDNAITAMKDYLAVTQDK